MTTPRLDLQRDAAGSVPPREGRRHRHRAFQELAAGGDDDPLAWRPCAERHGWRARHDAGSRSRPVESSATSSSSGMRAPTGITRTTNSAAQVGWGLYGPIVVEDPHDPKVFGDDLVLMLSDMSLDEQGTAAAEGQRRRVRRSVRPRGERPAGEREGAAPPEGPRRQAAALALHQRGARALLRLRDAWASRFMRLGGDNGLAERSEKLTRVSVVPGERLDVVFTPSSAPGTVSALRWLPRGPWLWDGLRPPVRSHDGRSRPLTSRAVHARGHSRAHLRDIPRIDVRQAVQHTLDLTIQLGGNAARDGHQRHTGMEGRSRCTRASARRMSGR